MRIEKSEVYLVAEAMIICAALVGFLSYPRVVDAPENQNVGISPDIPIIYAGATAATGTVASSVTPVFTTTGTKYSEYARITNLGEARISCYPESTQPASSTLSVDPTSPGAGIVIGSASTTPNGDTSVCFGPLGGCIPYVGPLNCIADENTPYAVMFK